MMIRQVLEPRQFPLILEMGDDRLQETLEAMAEKFAPGEPKTADLLRSMAVHLEDEMEMAETQSITGLANAEQDKG